ncbi:MAG: hypothetical protein OXJ64_18470, partial [Boseongicola sp.]|nr:hypothetical protein [Boseongicola sp.]
MMRLEAAQSNMPAQLPLHAQADSYGCCEANKAVAHTKPIKIRFVPRLSSSWVVPVYYTQIPAHQTSRKVD